jgi:dienelactone hydrolase
MARATVETVGIRTGDVELQGDLVLPADARGVVAFAHGSGSSRHSPRNRMVAEALHAGGFGTLLLDLLTLDEEREDRLTGHLRFDIGLLGRRTTEAVRWLAGHESTRALSAGLFGASTGAAAALVAAAAETEVRAVVSRGGRPDLAAEALPHVLAPTLLVVGGADPQVIEMNRAALARMTGPAELVIVPGATHLFEEPGALEDVARLAREWFDRYLAP